MRTTDSRINRYVAPLTLAALMSAAAMGIRSVAQSVNPASNTKATNVISRYFEAIQQTTISGTAATNLTEAEVSRLMNDSIKTDLAAQLWFRRTLQGGLSAQGAKMAGELRVLEILREGRTADAIRELEDRLDADIIFLAGQLRAVDEIKEFKPTPQSRTALQWARDYRLQFPHQSGDPAADDRVKDALSYLDKR